jgi:hypothetical protein
MAGSWLDSFGMGVYQAPSAIVEPKIQGSLLNEQQTGVGAPIVMKNTVPNPQGIGDSAPQQNYYKVGKALTIQDYTKSGSASEALKTAAGNAATNVAGKFDYTHEITRMFVGLLGLMLIGIGGLLFAAGAVIASPGASTIYAGRKMSSALAGEKKKTSWIGSKGTKKPSPVISEPKAPDVLEKVGEPVDTGEGTTHTATKKVRKPRTKKAPT